MTKDKLSESLEDYLECIYELVLEHKVARAKDIAEKLNVKRSSVTNALKSLSKLALVNYDPYSFVTLTKEGTSVAKEIVKSHFILKNFLMKVLNVSEQKAEENACRLEHAVDLDIIKKIEKFTESQ